VGRHQGSSSRASSQQFSLLNEKATRQQGQPFLQGRIVLTEVIHRQNFLAKSYEPKKAPVKEFLRNNTFIFNILQKG
jgi:hypothetical protein